MLGPPQVLCVSLCFLRYSIAPVLAQGSGDPLDSVVRSVPELTYETKAGDASLFAGFNGIASGYIVPAVLIADQNCQLILCSAAKQEGDVHVVAKGFVSGYRNSGRIGANSATLGAELAGGKMSASASPFLWFGTGLSAFGAEFTGIDRTTAAFPRGNCRRSIGQCGNRNISLDIVGGEAAAKDAGKIVLYRAVKGVGVCSGSAGDCDRRRNGSVNVGPDGFGVFCLLRLTGSGHAKTNQNENYTGYKSADYAKKKTENQHQNTIKTGRVFHKVHSFFSNNYIPRV